LRNVCVKLFAQTHGTSHRRAEKLTSKAYRNGGLAICPR